MSELEVKSIHHVGSGNIVSAHPQVIQTPEGLVFSVLSEVILPNTPDTKRRSRMSQDTLQAGSNTFIYLIRSLQLDEVKNHKVLEARLSAGIHAGYDVIRSNIQMTEQPKLSAVVYWLDKNNFLNFVSIGIEGPIIISNTAPIYHADRFIFNDYSSPLIGFASARLPSDEILCHMSEGFSLIEDDLSEIMKKTNISPENLLMEASTKLTRKQEQAKKPLSDLAAVAVYARR